MKKPGENAVTSNSADARAAKNVGEPTATEGGADAKRPKAAPGNDPARETSLFTRIQDLLRAGEITLPPLPEIATRLTQLLRNEKAADPRTVSLLVRNDPAIAASILRLANSASFGGLRHIEELDQAIARLGLRQVSAIVTAISHKGHFSHDDPERRVLLHRLWDHSIVCAMASKHLATLAGDDRGESFLAGLLHDVGKLMVLKALDQLEEKDGHDAFTPDVVDELMTLLHAQLGHDVLVSWKIPESICRIALHHHDERVEPHDALLIRVQAANSIARKLGASESPDPDLDLFEDPAIEALHLGDLELATLMVDVEDEIAQVRSLF
jgi:HD-like signal output (HDOD) protein